MPALLFHNHDGCGDHLLSLGRVELQALNTASNLFFAWAGASLAATARTSEARQSGILLVAVAWFSALYHATSSWGGFLLDIAAMAVWAGHLVGICQGACRALGRGTFLQWGTDERSAEWRVGAAAAGCAAALSGPFLAFELFDVDPVTAWNVWANSFLVLIVLAALPVIVALASGGLLSQFLRDIVASILLILLGVAFTQLIHLVCVPGHFTSFPLHSLWHVCSASSALFTVRVLDEALVMIATQGAAKGPSAAATPSRGSRGHAWQEPEESPRARCRPNVQKQ